MKQRIITALVLAPLAIAAVLWLPTAVFMGLVAAILLLGLWEFARLAGLPQRHLRAAVLALNAGLIGWLAWLGWSDQAYRLIALLGVIWWLLAAAWLGRVPMAREPTTANLLLKLGVGSLLVIPCWAAAALLHHDGAYGPRWTLFALLLVWGADTFAYFVGSRLGGAKLAPSISPGKTWAGFWGGMAGVALISAAAVPLLGLGYARWPLLLVLALATGVASVVGDLFESLIKRHSGAKDSGDLVPGHGGVMDRLDSILAALPVFVVLKGWLGL